MTTTWQVCWWSSGMAYLVSALLPPQSVLMAGVFTSLIFGAFLHGLSPTIASSRASAVEFVLALSYNRWARAHVRVAFGWCCSICARPCVSLCACVGA